MTELPSTSAATAPCGTTGPRDVRRAGGARTGRTAEPTWGDLEHPRVAGRHALRRSGQKDAIELGCGTGVRLAAWLGAARAASSASTTPSTQLATARRACSSATRSRVPAARTATRKSVPVSCATLRLRDLGVRRACGPTRARWVARGGSATARRQARPHWCSWSNSALLLMLCMEDGEHAALPTGDRLLRPAFGMYRLDGRRSQRGVSPLLATGSCCAAAVSRSRIWSVRRPRTPPRAIRSSPAKWARRVAVRGVWSAPRLTRIADTCRRTKDRVTAAGCAEDAELSHVRVCDCSMCRKARRAQCHRREATIRDADAARGAHQLQKPGAVATIASVRCAAFSRFAARTAPHMWTVNVRCLGSVDLASLPIERVHDMRLD